MTGDVTELDYSCVVDLESAMALTATNCKATSLLQGKEEWKALQTTQNRISICFPLYIGITHLARRVDSRHLAV